MDTDGIHGSFFADSLRVFLFFGGDLALYRESRQTIRKILCALEDLTMRNLTLMNLIDYFLLGASARTLGCGYCGEGRVLKILGGPCYVLGLIWI